MRAQRPPATMPRRSASAIIAAVIKIAASVPSGATASGAHHGKGKPRFEGKRGRRTSATISGEAARTGRSGSPIRIRLSPSSPRSRRSSRRIPRSGAKTSRIAQVLDRQRIDKWLWHARVVRTRTAAAALADRGKVRVNGARIDAPSKTVRAGDVVTIALDRVRVLKVLDFCERRGSAEAGRALYEDLAPPVHIRKAEDRRVAQP